MTRLDDPSAGRRDAVGAARVVVERIGPLKPRLALVLGSGLGGLADDIEDQRQVAYSDIPDFPVGVTAGHRGMVVGGRLEDVEVVALAGRVHVYEGWSAADAAFPVRVMHSLGVRTLFVSNAAGGIDPRLRPGDLMAIADHIDLMWRNPLVGPVLRGEARFPDMSEPYAADLRRILHEAASDNGIRLVDGVYCAVAGPSYETPAEIRMLERLGADAVGMSTVPEVIAARALGIRVAGVSLITNAAAGSSGMPLSHSEVLEVSERASAAFRKLVRTWIARLRGTPGGADLVMPG